MAARSRSRTRLVEALPEGTEEPPKTSHGTCAYCVPADHRKAPADECLIKMLGSEERKQVALTLYRIGREEGLFNKQCPMSVDKTYGTCPFYEDAQELTEDT